MCSFLRLVIMAAFCIVGAIAAPSQIKESVDTDVWPKLQVTEDDIAIAQRRNPQYNSQLKNQATEEEQCNSSKTSDSIPAANIVGYRNLWIDRDPTNDAYRNTHWYCDKDNAFVEGGMLFKKTDKKLYVPECGYYYVSSQVYFQQNSFENESTYAQHQLIVQTNCTGAINDIHMNAYATTNTTDFIATTFTGRLVKICAGGSISVQIPISSDRACCAIGRRDATYFSAYFVGSSDCYSNK